MTSALVLLEIWKEVLFAVLYKMLLPIAISSGYSTSLANLWLLPLIIVPENMGTIIASSFWGESWEQSPVQDGSCLLKYRRREKKYKMVPMCKVISQTFPITPLLGGVT